jgi:hypothetical protein
MWGRRARLSPSLTCGFVPLTRPYSNPAVQEEIDRLHDLLYRTARD